MWKFIGGLMKFALTLLLGMLIVHLLTFPPEKRGDRLRRLGIETLGGIENAAELGREALSTDPGTSMDLVARDDGERDADIAPPRSDLASLPDDFRRELAEAVSRIDVPN